MRLGRMVAGLRGLVKRTSDEQDLDEELRGFLAAAVEEKMRAGMSRDAATRAARIELGSPAAVRDRVRDVGWESAVERLWQDVRYALRSLRKAPGLTAVTIVTLALGIGANTAIFRLADAVRFRPLPVNRPEQLAEVRMADPTRGRMGTFAGRRPLFTYALWNEFRRRQQAFSGVVAWSAFPVNLSARGEAHFAQGLWVSGDFFDVLGVAPRLGRLLNGTDDQPGCGAPAAVFGYAFWQRQYGGDAAVIGKSVMLDGHPFDIVGVAPRRFVGLEVGRTFDVAAPICAEPILNREHSAVADRSWWWLTVIGRLAAGSSVERASSHLAAMSAGLFEATVPPGPADVAQAYMTSALKAYPASTGVSGTVREEYETPLWVLLAAAAVVLIIACANIATLLLVRATVRERELAVRLALGAGRGRLVRQLLAESVLLAAAGGAGAALLSQSLSTGLVGLLQTNGFQFFSVAFDLDPNWRVLAFGTGLALVTCLLFGLAPAVLPTRSSPAGLLRGAGRTSTDARPRAAARSGLVVVQIALSLLLVVTALLFVRTLRNLTTADIGFDVDNVTIAVVDYQRAKVPAENRLELQARLLDELGRLPGVQSAASVRMVPLTGESWTGHVVIDGVQHAKQSFFNRVSPGFFETMGTALLAGRDFTPADSLSSRRVAIVNASFARDVLGGRSPIGSTFQMPASPGAMPPTYEVVGLVADTKHMGLREPFEPIAFFPAFQERRPLEYVNVVVKAATPGIGLTRLVGDAVARVERDAVVFVQPFQAQIADSLVRERLLALLSGVFGIVAALLATLGLYGIVTYTVTERTREIGIRTALGAERSDVLALMLRHSTRLTALGIVLGLGAAAISTRYFATMLVGVSPLDPPTFAGASATFVAVAALASYIPARAATKVDPLVALRYE